MFNVSNLCTQRIISIDFNLNNGGTNLTLVGPVPPTIVQMYSYSWDVQITPPSVDVRLPNPPTKYLRFIAKAEASQFMVKGSTRPSFELFKFVVSGYRPSYPFVWVARYGTSSDVYGYQDLSMCLCTGCDSSSPKYNLSPRCTLGYPDSSTSRSPTIFNEDQVFFAFALNFENTIFSAYYNDEWPMTLGISNITNLAGVSTKSPLVFDVSKFNKPYCFVEANISSIMGFSSFNVTDPNNALDTSGVANGCNLNAPLNVRYTCPRPVPPSLYITDITQNPNARTGDWQQNGIRYAPTKICGIFDYASKKLTTLKSDGSYDYVITNVNNRDANSQPLVTFPAKPNSLLRSGQIDYGSGSDPIPANAIINPLAFNDIRPGWGAQIGWDLNSLGLVPNHDYRFQVMVHDGDNNGNGGDVGHGCVNIHVACDPGFITSANGATCSSCDLSPVGGIWTYFCSPIQTPVSSSGQAYKLVKIPTENLAKAPFAQYIANFSGFRVSENMVDKFGFKVTCDCKRIIVPCPMSCCGRGTCLGSGVCSCSDPKDNKTTCCPNPRPPVQKTPTFAPPEELFSTSRNNRYHFYKTYVEDTWTSKLPQVHSDFSLFVDEKKSVAIVLQRSPNQQLTDVIIGTDLQTGNTLWNSRNNTKFTFSLSIFLGVGFNHAWFAGFNSATNRVTIYALNTLTGVVSFAKATRLNSVSLQPPSTTCFDERANTIYVVTGTTLSLFSVGYTVDNDATSGVFAQLYLSKSDVPATNGQNCAVYDENSMVYVGTSNQKVQLYNVNLYDGVVTWQDMPSNSLSAPVGAPSVSIDLKVYVPGSKKFYVFSRGTVETVIPDSQISNNRSFSTYGTFVIDQDGHAITYDGNSFPTVKISPARSAGVNIDGYIIHEDSGVLVTFPAPGTKGFVNLYEVATGNFIKNAPSSWAPVVTGNYIVRLFPDMILMLENNVLRGNRIDSIEFNPFKRRNMA